MKSIETDIKLYIGIDWSYVFDWPKVNPDSTKDDLVELMEDMQEKLLTIEGRITLKSETPEVATLCPGHLPDAWYLYMGIFLFCSILYPKRR